MNKVKIIFVLLILNGFMLLTPQNILAADPLESDGIVELDECHHPALGFKILCGPDWPVEYEESKVRLTIDKTKDMGAYVSISRPNESGLKLEDLTPSALQFVYDYAHNFSYTEVRINNRKTIRVEAEPIYDPDGGLLDYFLLKNSKLYRVSFYVTPIKEFVHYRSIFWEMIGSFDFIDPTENEEKSQ